MNEKNNNILQEVSTEEIILNKKNYYITENKRDAFLVTSGKVGVYIAPRKAGNKKLNRKILIYEASAREMLPAFNWVDAENTEWYFCFVSLSEETNLIKVNNGSTRILKNNFSKKINIANMMVEGYENGLIEKYRLKSISENGQLYKMQKEKKNLQESNVQLIENLFSDIDNIDHNVLINNNALKDTEDVEKQAKGRTIIYDRILRKFLKMKQYMGRIFLAVSGNIFVIAMPVLIQILYDKCIETDGSFMNWSQIVAIILILLIGNFGFSIIKGIYTSYIFQKESFHIQKNILKNVFTLPEKFFQQYTSGDLLERTVGIIEAVYAKNTAYFQIFLQGSFICIYLTIIGYYSLYIAGICAALFCVYIGIAYLILSNSRKYQEHLFQLYTETTSGLYRLLAGISKIKMADIEERAVYEYLKHYTVYCKENMQKETKEIYLKSMISIINSILIMSICGLWIYGVLDLSTGVLLACLLASFELFESGSLLIQNILKLQQIRPVYKRALPILLTKEEQKGKADIPENFDESIALQNVSFTYNNIEKGDFLLNHISLCIRSGEYIGIVGESGCGKSTILRLLLGFEEPCSGEILYNGHDIHHLNPYKLRQHIGCVLQESKIIAGTIWDNITVVSPESTLEDVSKAIQIADFEEDIKAIPMGLEMIVQEDGSNLSKAQCQKILLARAVLNHPTVLFLDEVTSNLDNASKEQICRNLKKLSATKIMVTHQLDTLQYCDRIFALDKGAITVVKTLTPEEV